MEEDEFSFDNIDLEDEVRIKVNRFISAPTYSFLQFFLIIG